jgi:hypothetical protein
MKKEINIEEYFFYLPKETTVILNEILNKFSALEKTIYIYELQKITKNSKNLNKIQKEYVFQTLERIKEKQELFGIKDIIHRVQNVSSEKINELKEQLNKIQHMVLLEDAKSKAAFKAAENALSIDKDPIPFIESAFEAGIPYEAQIAIIMTSIKN